MSTLFTNGNVIVHFVNTLKLDTQFEEFKPAIIFYYITFTIVKQKCIPILYLK